ncbi:Maguk P55 sub member [Homalodisca vitripennis]|nr:Maguk P55 sub member [Homalodisca vitripennis]
MADILRLRKLVTTLDLAQNSNVQDAFLIAVEQQARERLERLSALKKIKPVDMSKLSQQACIQLLGCQSLPVDTTMSSSLVTRACNNPNNSGILQPDTESAP